MRYAENKIRGGLESGKIHSLRETIQETAARAQ